MYKNKDGIQFSLADTYDLDSTLSPIILSALKKFKEVITHPKRKDWMGCPGKLLSEMFPKVKHDYSEEQLQQASDQWLDIIDKMIYAFDFKNAPDLLNYDFELNMRTIQEFEDGTSQITIDHTNDDEYERYKDDKIAWQLKVEEGHFLFSCYLQSLWW